MSEPQKEEVSKEEVEGFKGEKQVIEICCRAIKRLKKFVAENNNEYNKQLKESKHLNDVLNEVCYLTDQKLEDETKEKEGTKKKSKGRFERNFRKCTLKCFNNEDSLKFKLSDSYSDKASEFMDKCFSSKIANFIDIETCNGNPLKAIERVMRLMDEAGLRLCSDSFEKFQKLFGDKLDSEDYKNMKKILSNEPAEAAPEDDPVHKSKGEKKSNKKSKIEFTAEECDALLFIDCFKSFREALSKKNALGFIEYLIKILEFFPFISIAQQKECIKVIETASRQISISDLMFQHPKEDYLYYCICFEYILESHDSEVIKEVYSNLKAHESIYEIKRFREQFVTALLDYQKYHESTPIYIQLGQRIVSFLIDETLSFGYKNGEEIEKKARSFWAEICRGDSIAIANSFYSLLGYLKNNNIRLKEEDLTFCRHNVYENYIKLKLGEIPIPEKVEISEESKYSNIPDHSELIPKFEKMFESIQTKKEINKKVNENYKFDQYSVDKIKELNYALKDLMKNEKSLYILEHHIMEIYNGSLVSTDDYKTLNHIINKISTLLNGNEYMVEEYGKATVENFGSSANSLWSMDSDIDIVIEFIKVKKNSKDETKDKKSKHKDFKDNSRQGNRKEQIKNLDYIQALKDIRNTIRRLAVNGEIEGVFGSRVPLLKFKDSRSSIDVDISVNNTIGIPNSKMTKLYCEFDQRTHIMITYLRSLFKKSNLLHGDQGSLSSYCIILMVIAFLQNQEDPILPNLQEVKDSKNSKVFYSINRNKFGRVDAREIKADLIEDLKDLQKAFVSKNTKSVAQLVIEFLQFFFLNPESDLPIIDVRKGGFTQGEKDKLPLFDIVEPFGHNSKVGLGCHKESHNADSYTKFAFEYCKNLVAKH